MTQKVNNFITTATSSVYVSYVARLTLNDALVKQPEFFLIK